MTKAMLTKAMEDDKQDNGEDDSVKDIPPRGHRPGEAGLELGVERLLLNVSVDFLDLFGPGDFPPQLPAGYPQLHNVLHKYS